LVAISSLEAMPLRSAIANEDLHQIAQSLHVGAHANPTGLGVVGGRDIGDTDVKLLYVLAEILVATTAQEPGDRLRRGKVGRRCCIC